MKKDIHPKYDVLTIRCVCGNMIETRSTTQGTLQVEICSACHPFFTGKQKLVDTAGRIDRLKKKFGEKIALGGRKKKVPPKAARAEKASPAEGQEKPSSKEK